MNTPQIPPHFYRYLTNKKPNTYIFKPVEDGFITTAGNPTLGSKYGNNYITAPPITIITQTDVKNK
jgi:hypothetical protein